jgi:hypothetical protein
VLTALLHEPNAAADPGGWGADLEIYLWLPNNDIELVNGTRFEITMDDILSDLDMFAMAAGRIRRGRWSFAADVIYGDVSNNSFDSPLLLPGLATFTEGAIEAWIVTPNIGYTVIDNDQQKIELYAGARYFRIETDLVFEIEPILPGQPTVTVDETIDIDSWDGIAGVRGLVYLSDKWFIPYSANAGAGDSDFTWTAQGGLGYRFGSLDALFGWRHMYYDVGSDTAIREIKLNGPFAGVMFRW